LGAVLATDAAMAQTPPPVNQLSKEARASYDTGMRRLQEGNLLGAAQSSSDVIERHPEFADG
jgi:hypothetical protein